MCIFNTHVAYICKFGLCQPLYTLHCLNVIFLGCLGLVFNLVSFDSFSVRLCLKKCVSNYMGIRGNTPAVHLQFTLTHGIFDGLFTKLSTGSSLEKYTFFTFWCCFIPSNPILYQCIPNATHAGGLQLANLLREFGRKNDGISVILRKYGG